MSGRCMTHNTEDVKISVKIVLITKNGATASEAEWSLLVVQNIKYTVERSTSILYTVYGVRTYSRKI
jgi:hypothetical protein